MACGSELNCHRLRSAARPAKSAGQPIIAVRDLVHRYQDRNALNGVSFDVRPAELFGLLGPNGSGKTTLFRILSTLMVPTSGSATIAGLDVVRQPGALRRHIGVVFQAQSVDPSSPLTKTSGIRDTSTACAAPNSRHESMKS
jgi:ABC-type branched-subunit amino acid transport system ATPase component